MTPIDEHSERQVNRSAEDKDPKVIDQKRAECGSEDEEYSGKFSVGVKEPKSSGSPRAWLLAIRLELVSNYRAVSMRFASEPCARPLVISVAAYALPFSGAARAAPDATTCYVAIFNLSTIRIATDTAFAASS